MGAAAVMAALAFGVAGTTAHAAAQPVRAEAASATISENEAARQIAANLLKYEGNRFNAQDRAELQAIADGTAVEAQGIRAGGGKFGALIKVLKKVPGFAKAVMKKYDDFKKWYGGLPWYVRGPLAAMGVGSDLYGIWQMFH
ncbi:hypothetical protein ACFY12_04510 [Streptomyces sp. NPDC001339]|uniref:hypothetical protein n=1 Tax=Streptomyces sp. NPDC001339 TaxID=3364563 RepID=UPI0036928170